MGIPRYAVLTGTVDGANRVFYTPTAYTPQSTAVFINGQLKRADLEDGWVETDATTGAITLSAAPITLDIVQAFYIDTTPDGASLQLAGILEDTISITGLITTP